MSTDNAKTIASLRTYWCSAVFTDTAHKFKESTALTDYYANQAFQTLMEKYQQPHRKYHNLSHLMFLKSLPSGSDFGKPFDSWFFIERIMFFFYHDSEYFIDPINPILDNEHQSAVGARQDMLNMGFGAVKPEIIDFVCDTIELSNHVAPTSNPKQQFLLDCDLAILGASPSSYLEYTKNIRSEYGVVPQDVWDVKRAEFLEYMLDKENVFQHPFFQRQYEKQARKNMAAELKTYSGKKTR